MECKVMYMYKEELEKAVNKLIKEMEQSMLEEIHGAVCNDSLNDFDCIEKNLEIFEKNGIRCGTRHDF